MNILVVCRGNVGRSQIAEALLKKYAPASWRITSVGTRVIDKEGNSVEGEKLRDRAGAEAVLTVLYEAGIDAREAERNQITEKAVEEADVIVSMAERETLPGYLKESKKVRFWDIQDPKEKTLEEVRKIRDRVTKLVEGLISELA
jgi:protein-tyrosine-phosphatase